MAKPLGLPLTSTEAEAKFAWRQKKKNTQTRLTFVSNLGVNFVQIIGGQTTFLSHSQPTIRWETIRTLGLIANYETEIIAEIETFTTDLNEQIKQASMDSRNRIEQRNRLK